MNPTSGHLLCEEGDELCEVDGSGGLREHVGGVSVGDRLANVAEGGLEVTGGDDAVLVGVHDADSLLELLDLLLGEEGEDVGAGLLGLPVEKKN